MEMIIKQIVIEQMGVAIYEATEDKEKGEEIKNSFLNLISKNLGLSRREEEELHEWANGYLANE